MKNLMVRTHTFTVLTSRLVVMVLFAALLSAAPFHAALAADAPNLGTAESFAVLGASTVTNTGLTTVTGDLGLSPGTSVTGFQAVDGGPGIIVNGNIFIYPAQKAIDAQSDAALAYAALVAAMCTTNLTGQDLGTLPTLTPGVYCFSSSAQLTGTLVLDAQNNSNAVFIFQIGSTLTTASNSSVVVINAGQNCDGFNVFWQVGSSATLGTDTAFSGNILALTSITLTTGASVAGRAFALNGAVTMDTNTVSVCGSGNVVNPNPSSIKVTGGGQIPVPNPDSNVPSDTGTGRATFGFNAQPDKKGGTAKGNFNYVNHVTGLHVNGPVDDVVVIATNPLDGSPKTVRFSGTCDGNLPACSFSVTVEDHAEPGTIDEFGITVTGALSEVRSQRSISRGNIQFHK